MEHLFGPDGALAQIRAIDLDRGAAVIDPRALGLSVPRDASQAGADAELLRPLSPRSPLRAPPARAGSAATPDLKRSRSASASSVSHRTSHPTATAAPAPSSRTEIQVPGTKTAQPRAIRIHITNAVSPAARSASSTIAAASKSCQAAASTSTRLPIETKALPGSAPCAKGPGWPPARGV